MICKLLAFFPLFSAFAFLAIQAQTSSSQTFWPAAVPLAVRSPYFSSWLFTLNGTQPLDTWPTFWNDDAPLGWAGHIRVDNETYRWLGQDPGPNSTNLTGISVTPTQTIWTTQAGPMDLTVTFLTPIEPADWVRQSIPFSYLSIEASSNDGKAHNVQVYSDISAEWLSGNRSALVNWTTVTTPSSVYHQIQLDSPSSMTEIDSQAVDGTLYYSMNLASGVTYETGASCRTQFQQSGSLTDGQDTSFRAINNNFPIYAISVDLGSITSTQSPVVWSVGFIRNPSIQYTDSTGATQLRSPLYATQYPSASDVIDAFLIDFSDAQTRANTLDKQILQNASAISAEYGNLVSLAARQAFGGIDITVANGTDGQWNTSDIKIFMKNIGTDRRVNPVEILYQAFPVFIYLNASFGKPLLAPLLEFQDSPQYTLPYAARDLGSNYPIASGDTASHQEGVEETANMLIMTLAHARTSGDGSLLNAHYSMLKNWGDYLANNSLAPINQVTADTQNIANLTNLAIKGIIGVQAMSEISRALNQDEDAQQFALQARSDVSQWQSLAVDTSAPAHFMESYGQPDSWSLMYNLYADLLLGTNLVPESLYQMQSDYYQTLTAAKFGLPIDNSLSDTGNSGWLAFTAASAQNSTVRNELLSMIWSHASYNLTVDIFPTSYSVSTGDEITGIANPGQGAMFAPLALSVPNTTITVPPPSASSASSALSTKSTSHAGAIAGGVVGGVVGLGVVAFAVFFFSRQRRATQIGEKREDTRSSIDHEAHPYEITPFVPERSREPPLRAAPLLEVEDTTPSGTIDISEKVREYLDSRGPPATGTTSESTATPSGISTAPESTNPPSTVGSTHISPVELRGLRTEVENLRRVMQEIHAERMEAPPEYEPEV